MDMDHFTLKTFQPTDSKNESSSCKKLPLTYSIGYNLNLSDTSTLMDNKLERLD